MPAHVWLRCLRRLLAFKRFMMWTALAVAAGLGELGPGADFLASNPLILRDVANFAACRSPLDTQNRVGFLCC